jgi:dsRNA-specific ribonuclease
MVQKGLAGEPEYSESQVGGDFVCGATVLIGGAPYIGEGRSRQKKEAKKQAVKAALTNYLGSLIE